MWRTRWEVAMSFNQGTMAAEVGEVLTRSRESCLEPGTRARHESALDRGGLEIGSHDHEGSGCAQHCPSGLWTEGLTRSAARLGSFSSHRLGGAAMAISPARAILLGVGITLMVTACATSTAQQNRPLAALLRTEPESARDDSSIARAVTVSPEQIFKN